jgi:glycerate kinase
MPTVLAAPDKFRGTLTAAEAAAAVVRAARAAGWRARAMPVADGGEGTLEAVGGRPRFATVTGPLGDPVRAEWRFIREGGEARAVVEMARASGLSLVGGPAGNDPLAATTYGTGELIAAAVEAGATEVVVGAGGSATTDGGLGAIRALEPHRRLRGVELVVACDVMVTFVEAAAVFAPQKGATPAQVALLTRRLERLAQLYEREFGVDVRAIPGSGAAGGLAGGLAALGARLAPGFDVVAEALNLPAAVAAADLVVTGEGALDEQTFNGKAVGGVVDLAAAAGVPVLVVAGEVDPGAVPPGRDLPVVSLTARFGPERARADAAACIEEVVSAHLSALAGGRRLGA